MKENTNKAIVVNTLILYIKLAVNAICGLLTTRFALQALGAIDFGLFSVVGSIITIVSMLNVIMLSTSNRFIASAIGKKRISLINETFNVNLVVHSLIAIFTLLIAFPVGDWYIINYVNFEGDINLAVKVYNITVLGSVISFIGVPYNGLIFAHEKFLFASSVDVISQICKMGGAYSLLYFFDDKLSVYAILLSVLSAFPTIAYALYCNRKFRKEVALKFVKATKLYKEILGFSVWVGYGAIAFVGKAQGAALIVNRFFNTVLNTALGIANSINGLLQTISGSITKSISPQITKSYAAGDYNRCENLVIIASKVNFLLLLICSSPFISCSDLMFNLWLGETPYYADVFLKLLIFDALITALNAGIPDLIFATGKIKWYQIIVNTLYLLSVVVAFWVLKHGAPAYCLQITYIIFSVIIFCVRQVVIKMVVKFNSIRIIKQSYIPSIVVFICFIAWTYVPLDMNDIIRLSLNLIILFVLSYLIGLTKKERVQLNNYVANFFNYRLRTSVY